MACLKCKRETSNMFPFRVLEVQTLHIRDMGGEKRVQALGKFQNYKVCENCAKEKLENNLSFRKSALPRILKFALVFLVGAAATAFLWNAELPYRLLALAAMVCGSFGMYEAWKNGKRHRLDFQSMSQRDAIEAAAWEVLLDEAPKKSEDSDLTYIPVNKKTRTMKNGDLMIMYDLLPEIAIKAYSMIRSGD